MLKAARRSINRAVGRVARSGLRRRAGLALIVLTTALPSIACLTPADARSDGGRRDAGKSQEGQGTTPAPNPGRDAGGSDATSTPEVSSPASGSSDGGGGALMPPTTPAMMPDAGQPGGPPASTPTSMTANLIFKDQPLFCLDVVNFPKDIILRTTSCAERALGQSFLVGSDNRFRFPASTFTSGDGVTYVAGSYCLSSDENANPQATSTQVPTLEICDPSDNAQKWEKRGSVLATVGNRCMTLTKAASADGFIIGLEGCQPEAANQGWIVGSPKDHAPARVMFVSNADKNSCVRVLDFPADPSVRWENCDGRDDFNHDRKFLLGTDGRFRYPATRSVIDKGKVYPVGSQCLTASNGSPAISLLPCDPAARNQVWSRDNDAIKSLGTGLCLSRSDGSEHVSLKFPELKLQPCVVSDVLQSWTLGDYWTMELARIQAAKAAPPSLDIACKPPSVIKFIDRDPNTALVQKIRGLFGGEAAL
ncbi:MAG TPA: hypothetical protein VGG33_01015, partial [Polyangia bacterium]